MFFSTLLSVNDIKIEPQLSADNSSDDESKEEEQQFQYLKWLNFPESVWGNPQLDDIKKATPAFRDARLIDRLDDVFNKRCKAEISRRRKQEAQNSVLPPLDPPNILVHLDTSMIVPETSSAVERNTLVSPVLRTQIRESIGQSIKAESAEKGVSERESIVRESIRESVPESNDKRNRTPMTSNSIDEAVITPIRKEPRSIRRRLFNSPYATPEYSTPRAGENEAGRLNRPSIRPQLKKGKTYFPEPEAFGTVLRKARSVFQDPQSLLDVTSRVPSATPSCLLPLLKRKSLLQQRKRVNDEQNLDSFSCALVAETPLRVQAGKGDGSDEKSNEIVKLETFFDKLCKESPMVQGK